jgi:hypothetical protein
MTEVIDIVNISRRSSIDDHSRKSSTSDAGSVTSSKQSRADIKASKIAAQAALIAEEVALRTKNTPGSQFLAAGKYGCRPIPPKSEETAVIASKLHRDIINVVRDNKTFDIYSSYTSTAPDLKPTFSSSVYRPKSPKYNKIVNDPLVDFCKTVTTKNTPKKKTITNKLTSTLNFPSSSIKINDIETMTLPDTSGPIVPFVETSDNNFTALSQNFDTFNEEDEVNRNNETIEIEGDKSTLNLSTCLIDNNVNELSNIDNESYNDQENEENNEFQLDNNNNNHLNKNSLTFSYSDGSVASPLFRKGQETPVTTQSGRSFTHFKEEETSKKKKVKHIVPKEKFSPLYWRVWNSEFALLQNLSKNLSEKEASSKKNYGTNDDLENNKKNEIKSTNEVDSVYVPKSPRRPQTWEVN